MRSITTSWPNCWRYAIARRTAEMHARRVVGVDVDDRDVEALGEVRGPVGRAAVVRVGREADLVVRDQVDRAADAVAVERLAGSASRPRRPGPGTRRRRGCTSGSADEVRGARAGPGASSARRARAPTTTGFTYSRWRRVAHQVHEDRAAVGQHAGRPASRGGTSRRRAALRESCPRRGSSALELGEDRLVGPPRMCASTFSRPRCAMPTTTSRPPCAAARSR